VSVDGRVAVVTGASRGIGRALAVRLAREGARVVVAARSEEARSGLPGSIYEVAHEISALGGVALPVRVDVGVEDDVRRLVAICTDRLGRLDILVNNASALWWQPLLKTPPRRFGQMLRTNLLGAYLCTYHCLPSMIANGWGHVIGLAPPIIAEPPVGRGTYTAVKNAAARLAMSVAQEHASDGIAANTLWTRAYVETQATINWALGDRHEWRSPELVADAVMQILGTVPPSLTGQQLVAEDVLRNAGWADADFARYVTRG